MKYSKVLLMAVALLTFSGQVQACGDGSLPPQIDTDNKLYAGYVRAGRATKKNLKLDTAEDFYNLVRGKDFAGSYYSRLFFPMEVSFVFDDNMSSASAKGGDLGVGYTFLRSLAPVSSRSRSIGCSIAAVNRVNKLSIAEMSYKSANPETQVGAPQGFVVLPKRHVVFNGVRTDDYYFSATVMNNLSKDITPPFKWVKFPSFGKKMTAVRYEFSDRVETHLEMRVTWSLDGSEGKKSRGTVCHGRDCDDSDRSGSESYKLDITYRLKNIEAK